MIRISLSYFYTVATHIEPLDRITPGDTVGEHLVTLFIAELSISQLLENSVFAREIKTSRQSANNLSEYIKTIRIYPFDKGLTDPRCNFRYHSETIIN